MKKFLLGVIMFVAASAVVFGSANQQAATSSGVVTVNFYSATDLASFTDELISLFNAKNNGIRVVAHYTPNDDYDDKVKVLAAGSRDMDAFWIRNPAPAQQYIAQNALADLTPYAQASGLDLAPIRDSSLKGATDASGKFYGLPTTGSCWMIFYNKELFDAKGLPYPINLTWDQYLDLAKQLTYTEGNKKYWGGVCPPWVLNLGAAAGGEYLTASNLTRTRAYAEVQHRMYIDDHSHPDIGEMSIGTFDINSVFASGNVYMMINGDWTFSLLDASFDYGAAPLPVFAGMPAGSSAGSLGYYAVSRSSAHPKEAYQFIEWALTSEEASAIVAAHGNIPCYPSVEAEAVYKKNINVPGVEYRFSSKISQEQGTEPYYNAVKDAFDQEIQLYLLDEQTLDQTFTNFSKLRSEVIANNR
jgi:ABC-type glycerol-3-phosphate transport system substrate-binding protein